MSTQPAERGYISAGQRKSGQGVYPGSRPRDLEAGLKAPWLLPAVTCSCAHWVMSAITNLVINLFRIQGVTKFKAETRHNAQDPRRPLHLLDLSPG